MTRTLLTALCLTLLLSSRDAVKLDLQLTSLPKDLRTRHIVLDATSPGDDENSRLRPEPFKKIGAGNQTISVELEPYAVHYWSFE